MEKEQILTTKLTIEGAFYDSQLYSGKLYLWQHSKQLAVYDWNKWQLALNQIQRPVYFEPQPFESLAFTLSDLEPYLERTLAFEEAPYDTALFNHQLYFSDSTGFYSYSLQRNDAEIKQLWDLPVVDINVSKTGRFALACEAAGLYEYDASKRFTKHSALAVSPDIYQLTNQFASHSEWAKQNLIQYGLNPHKEDLVLIFHFHQQEIILDQIVVAQELLKHEQSFIEELPLPLATSKPIIDEGLLFSFDPLSRTLAREKHYRSKSVSVKAQPSKLNQQFPLNSATIYIQEKANQLTISLNNEPLRKITAPIRKWRIFDRTIYYRNQLHVMTEQECSFYLFTELIH